MEKFYEWLEDIHNNFLGNGEKVDIIFIAHKASFEKKFISKAFFEYLEKDIKLDTPYIKFACSTNISSKILGTKFNSISKLMIYFEMEDESKQHTAPTDIRLQNTIIGKIFKFCFGDSETILFEKFQKWLTIPDDYDFDSFTWKYKIEDHLRVPLLSSELLGHQLKLWSIPQSAKNLDTFSEICN